VRGFQTGETKRLCAAVAAGTTVVSDGGSSGKTVRFTLVRGVPFGTLVLGLLGLRPGFTNVDRRRIKRALDVCRVEFLDHLDAGAAVLGNLINVGALHQAQADIGVAQAIGRGLPSRSSLSFVRSRRLLNIFFMVAGETFSVGSGYANSGAGTAS
jgi:hypothetical protein